LRDTKTYIVRRTPSGTIEAAVEISGEGHRSYLLPHVPLHSPTGFETGYSGSGPADLAASILADYFHVTPEVVAVTWKKSWGLDATDAAKVIRYHQLFKQHHVAPYPLEVGESWSMTDIEVCQFLILCNEHIGAGDVIERLPGGSSAT
jgi:hypothetical protein